jgi:hypothetical protein
LSRKLRITVNTDPLVSSKDRQSELFLRDFIRPFPNISRLEIDYTMLKLNDPRIQDQLLALPDPDHSDFGGSDDDSEESGSEESSTEGSIAEESSTEESSTEEPSTKSRTTDPIAEGFLSEEAGIVESAKDSTVVTFQLKVSVPRHRRSKKLPYHGFGSWNLKQHSLLFQQVNMANLCHVHLSYDFENLTNSHGSIMPCMLADVGKQVWPCLKTLKICITYEVDPRFPNWPGSDPVSRCPLVLSVKLLTLLEQEGLLWYYVDTFAENRWHWPDITLVLSIRDVFTPGRGSFPESDGVTAEMYAESALKRCRAVLPPLKAFGTEAPNEYFATVPPNLNLQVHAYALSFCLEGCVPLLLIRHDAGTHRYHFSEDELRDTSEEDLWLNHFECIEYAPEAASLAEGTKRVLMLDIDNDADSYFALGPVDTSSETSSESGISDSFRRSPSPF